MAAQRDPRPFVAKATKSSEATATGSAKRKASGAASPGRSSSQVIPERVANRMARRVALATGVPTLLGMAVFVVSYLLVSQKILAIPTSATLLGSGACFLLGLVGLSYGVLSASWEDAPGSLLGSEQIPLNFGRIRTSLQAMRRGSEADGSGLS